MSVVGIAPVLGVLGGLAGVADTIPYVRDICRGTTRPHRGAWLVWTVLAVVVCFAQRADGASWSLLLTATQAVLTGVVFALAVRRGEGGLGRFDLGLLIVAGGGLLGWFVARQPAVAVGCVIAADVCAMAMMLPKAYRDPESETMSTFAWASLGGAFAVGAVGATDVSLLLYPVYFCLANGAMALLLTVRRGAVARSPAVAAGPLICGHPSPE